MRKKIMLPFFILLGILFFNSTVAAQEIGCCCNPDDGTAQKGSMQEETACDQAAGYGFVQPRLEDILGKPASSLCYDVCEAAIPGIVLIEVELECGNPAYVPAAGNVFLVPVRGESRFNLVWNQNCTDYVNKYDVYRCAGDGCENFQLISTVSTTSFEDSTQLSWDTDYRYKISTSFTHTTEVAETVVEGNTGAIECTNKITDNAFCLALNSYVAFENYLSTYGYGTRTEQDFTDAFALSVQAIFGNNFNKAFSCNAVNQLLPDIACGSNEICVATATGAECREVGICSNRTVGGHFGLNYQIATCEGSAAEKSFCFYDRSHSLANNCYACQIGMNCLDYRSQGVCQRDNCGLGPCEWRPTYGDIGVGVCVNPLFPSCDLCDFQGSPGMENLDAYNEIYDQCSKARSDALANPGYPCFFDPGTRASKSCEDVSCVDYLQAQCAGPPGGIQLDANNNVIVGSTDPCQIGVCAWEDLGCYKNADGKPNIGDSIRDCTQFAGDAEAVERCEYDYFAPRTTVVTVGEVPGRTDYLEIYRHDRERFGEAELSVRGEDGYPTFFCVYRKNETPCVPNMSTNGSLLIVDNLFLQALIGGEAIIVAGLELGVNTLRYYSKDIHENLEIVQEIDFIACDGCQGPKALNATLVGGNFIEDIWYTREGRPAFDVLFNVPVNLVVHQYIKGSSIYGTSVEQFTNTSYRFTGIQPLVEGNYMFQLDATNDEGTSMFPGFDADFVYDITPPDLVIYGNDELLAGNVYTQHDLAIRFEFDEQVKIAELRYTANFPEGIFSSDFTIVDMLPHINTADNQTWGGSFDIPEGPVWIYIKAYDYAGNEEEFQFSTHIHADGPTIRLKEPSYGVSPELTFDIVAETLNPATCRFWFSVDVPPIPPPPIFSFLEPFDTETEGDLFHNKFGVDRITEIEKKHPLFVRCQDAENREASALFDLWVDPYPPEITNAEADPDPIIQFPYKTHLKVTTKRESFCTYSDEQVEFEGMEKFPGYGRLGSRAQDAEVEVDAIGDYLYYISCIGLNELGPDNDTITFSVVPGAAFDVTSLTQRYFGISEVDLVVSTNKDALCYYSSGGFGVGTLMGDGTPGFSHSVTVTETDGTYTYKVTCATGGETVINGTPESKRITIIFTVDTSPPVMDSVDDSSTLVDTPEITYDSTQLRVKFKGHDDNSAISKYELRVNEKGTTNVVVDWTSSTKEDEWVSVGGTFADGKTYEFEVKAQNIVGLESSPLKSDGVTVDSGALPAHCTDGVKDPTETDVDCGGECYGCGEGQSCVGDGDCASNFCTQGICAAVSCDDGIQNGQETGVDCGGACGPCAGNVTTQVCSQDAECYPGYCDTTLSRCIQAARCVSNTDCTTGFCDSAGYCVIASQCFDGLFNGDETDLDCGGSCPTKCDNGQKCLVDNDCMVDSQCVNTTVGFICKPLVEVDVPGMEPDDDGDGIPNWWEEKYCGGPTACDPGADLDDDGLTNLEEYNIYKLRGWEIDPTNADTDGDGYEDKWEIDHGYNPIDLDSHPMAWWWWFIIMLLVLTILGIAAYFIWQYREELKLEEKKPPGAPPRKIEKVPPFVGAPKPKVSAAAEKIKGLFAPEKPEEFVSLQELQAAERKKVQAKAMETKEIFTQLQRIRKGKSVEAVEAGKRPPSEIFGGLAGMRMPGAPGGVMTRLQQIALEGLSDEEREKMIKQLQLLRLGKLSPEEREELLKRLRITATYYEKNKDQLQEELEKWLAQKVKVKKIKKKK